MARKILPGDPRVREKIEGHFDSSIGRSLRWKMTARDVPPRQYAAGSDRCDVEMPFHMVVNIKGEGTEKEPTLCFLFRDHLHGCRL